LKELSQKQLGGEAAMQLPVICSAPLVAELVKFSANSSMINGNFVILRTILSGPMVFGVAMGNLDFSD
jgi:hypothetical protein